jgi:hypothetical protein
LLFAFLRNVVPVVRQDPLWRWDAVVDLPGLREAWRFVVSTGPAFVAGQRVVVPDPTQQPTAAPTVYQPKEGDLLRPSRGKQVPPL